MTTRPLDAAGYLRRLGLADPGPPSVAGLRAAHVERIPYEALEIQLRRPASVDPYEAAERIVARRRGGYCYHLNGAFSLLLDALGYDVRWHRAGVQNHSDPAPVGAGIANHLALTVHGLPAPDSYADSHARFTPSAPGARQLTTSYVPARALAGRKQEREPHKHGEPHPCQVHDLPATSKTPTTTRPTA